MKILLLFVLLLTFVGCSKEPEGNSVNSATRKEVAQLVASRERARKGNNLPEYNALFPPELLPALVAEADVIKENWSNAIPIDGIDTVDYVTKSEAESHLSMGLRQAASKTITNYESCRFLLVQENVANTLERGHVAAVFLQRGQKVYMLSP